MTIYDLLAIDPGPTWMGWAHLRVQQDPGVRCTYVAGGDVLSERIPFARLLDETAATVVAVETPAGHIFSQARAKQLLETTWVAGGLAWYAEGRDRRVVRASAQQVRHTLTGRNNADDALVRDTVVRNVFGCPRTGSEHVADAVAVGIIGAWVVAGHVRLPDPNAPVRRKPGGRGKGQQRRQGA